MELQEIISIATQILGVLFILALGGILVWSMTRDGKLTANEASKVTIMIGFIYAMIVNGSRPVDTSPVFDSSIMLILLGSVLTMAGIDAYKLIKDKKNDKSN